LGIESWKLSSVADAKRRKRKHGTTLRVDARRSLAQSPSRGHDAAGDVGGSLTSNHHLADYPARCAAAKFIYTDAAPEKPMKICASRFTLAALALCAATSGFAQDAQNAARGATHDCSGMTGTALATCQQLNRSPNERAPSGAGTPNDCSGLTGAPLASCRRLNAADTTAPASSIGPSEDCSGQVGDALKACRTLNGQSTEYDASTAGAAGAGGTARP